jgi:Zn-dependent M28 family amino/carboxypeptidase
MMGQGKIGAMSAHQAGAAQKEFIILSNNVIALLPGSKQADECIIYMSHWDHFGKDPALEGDQIFDGAVDNATGTAALLELAKGFKNLKHPPLRSIVFLAVSGEEQGLIGSEYYATHFIFPTAKTVAVINMDALNVYGRMKDITVIGYGLSELDQYIEAAAKEAGRTVNPDPTPEKGSYFRSDHFPFAKQGIPAVYPSGGEKTERWLPGEIGTKMLIRPGAPNPANGIVYSSY